MFKEHLGGNTQPFYFYRFKRNFSTSTLIRSYWNKEATIEIYSGKSCLLKKPISWPMELLNTYDERDASEAAAEKLVGEKRLASERDATVVIYNLFGIPNWGNFRRLGMYNLNELKSLLERRTGWQPADQARHA